MKNDDTAMTPGLVVHIAKMMLITVEGMSRRGTIYAHNEDGLQKAYINARRALACVVVEAELMMVGEPK